MTPSRFVCVNTDNDERCSSSQGKIAVPQRQRRRRKRFVIVAKLVKPVSVSTLVHLFSTPFYEPKLCAAARCRMTTLLIICCAWILGEGVFKELMEDKPPPWNAYRNKSGGPTFQLIKSNGVSRFSDPHHTVDPDAVDTRCKTRYTICFFHAYGVGRFAHASVSPVLDRSRKCRLSIKLMKAFVVDCEVSVLVRRSTTTMMMMMGHRPWLTLLLLAPYVHCFLVTQRLHSRWVWTTSGRRRVCRWRLWCFDPAPSLLLTENWRSSHRITHKITYLRAYTYQDKVSRRHHVVQQH
jgi:hypothetical protein